MKKIMLLTDFSELSEFAKSLAQKISTSSNAELHVVSIVDIPTDIELTEEDQFLDNCSSDISKYVKLIEERKQKMDEWTNNLSGSYHTHVVPGRLFQKIEKLNKRHSFDLILMGTHGRRGLEAFFNHSVAEQLIKSIRVPVLTVKCDRELIDFSDFLISGDFDSEAKMNLDTLITLQKVFDTKLHMLYVNTKRGYLSSEKAMDKMKQFVETNELTNVEYHIHNDKSLEDGIVNFANNYDEVHDLDIDIIAVEKKDKSELGYLFTGCTSTSIVNHVQRPILTYLSY